MKKQIFSYETIKNHYIQLNLFACRLKQTQVSAIDKIDASCICRYFSYLEETRKYKRYSLQVVQIVLTRFFQSMRLRRLIGVNPVKDFHIKARKDSQPQTILSPFDLMRLLRSVKEHYRYLLDHRKAHKFSLFIHRRDLCIFALCAACGLRRA